MSILYIPPSYAVPEGPGNVPFKCIKSSLLSAGAAVIFEILSALISASSLASRRDLFAAIAKGWIEMSEARYSRAMFCESDESAVEMAIALVIVLEARPSGRKSAKRGMSRLGPRLAMLAGKVSR